MTCEPKEIWMTPESVAKQLQEIAYRIKDTHEDDAMNLEAIAQDIPALVERLISEKINKLRAPLRRIRDHEHIENAPQPYPQEDPYYDGYWRYGHQEGHRCCAKIAREALE